MKRTIEKLLGLSTAPDDSEAFERWLEQGDALSFLRDNASASDVVVYAGLPHTFIHAVLVPEASVSPPEIRDLMSWSCNTYSSWSVVSSASQVCIQSPLSHSGSKTLACGEQLVFGRSFEGVPERERYIEILQKFVHVSGIHHMPERSAWCRLDRRGDIEDVVRVHNVEARGDHYGSTVVTINHRLLHEYAALTQATLVWMFDFTRFRPSLLGMCDFRGKQQFEDESGLSYRYAVQPGCASYLRGIQIGHAPLSRDEILQHLWGGDRDAAKQYAALIVYDWKHRRVTEMSCAPSALANYFTESDLPFEATPAFFHPKVLLKYKADREKYQLKTRSISYRGAWHLETYDINDAGQIHTYLVYLSRLPYEEQLHWKQYNEPPKAPISERAFTTDFKGKWGLDTILCRA
ncbi:MAG: hypothetical protein ACREJ5_11810 [Geminicoccaceae bacterium]